MPRAPTSRTGCRRRPRAAHAVAVAAALAAVCPAIAAGAVGLTAVRTPVPPRIDGVLEQAWQTALRISRFEQLEPSIGAPASVRTEVFVLYDARNLYLAARAHQPHGTIRGSRARRDSATAWDGDYVLFAVDSHDSGNSAHFLLVNPANAVIDGLLDSAGTWNPSWDGRILTATAVGESGWTAEAVIPLDSIGFQARQVQQWGFLAGRHFAGKQEKVLSSIADRDAAYRVDAFPRLTGIELQRARPQSAVTPYLYTSLSTDGGSARRETKSGVDLRLSPVPSMRLLATFRPDYAQLETDREIISGSDVPTSYPEERPFFTESSDLYPGLAVNTRNIGDIEAGVKLRQVLARVRYDLTIVEDASHARWFLGDVRWTDNRRYHLELIGGLKDTGYSSDYNVTANLRTWLLERRLTAYTWFGTMNGRGGESSQWESVNSIRWVSRNLRAGVWNHLKTELYNPNIVGHNALSNEVIVKVWVGWSRFPERGRVLGLSSEITAEHFDLYSARGNDHVRLTGRLTGRVRASDRLGVWAAELEASPKRRQTFRHRGLDGPAGPVHRDGFGPFVLVEQTAGAARSEDGSFEDAGGRNIVARRATAGCGQPAARCRNELANPQPLDGVLRPGPDRGRAVAVAAGLRADREAPAGRAYLRLAPQPARHLPARRHRWWRQGLRVRVQSAPGLAAVRAHRSAPRRWRGTCAAGRTRQ